MTLIRKRKFKLPIFPLSVFIFYLIVFVLWNKNIIPSPKVIVGYLELLLDKYSIWGLVLATALEGIAYVCLYVPGSFIIALAVFLSRGDLISLLKISIVVASTLTITSAINYIAGSIISSKRLSKELISETQEVPKKLILAILHPNILAFYFFHSGLEHKNIKNIFYVPILLIPYGFIIGYILSTFSQPVRQALEDPYSLLIFVVLWLVISIVSEYKKSKSRVN